MVVVIFCGYVGFDWGRANHTSGGTPVGSSGGSSGDTSLNY